MLNKTMRAPRPPGEWVTEEECRCGAIYKKSSFGVTFDDGAMDFDSLNGDEGYRSRGPVLWAMRCRKLSLWYEAHRGCGEENDE